MYVLVNTECILRIPKEDTRTISARGRVAESDGKRLRGANTRGKNNWASSSNGARMTYDLFGSGLLL